MELYSLGRLPEPLAAAVEEHLLVCGKCQERLDELEVFATAMRRAISEEPVLKPGGWRFPTWSLAFAGGLAALVAAIVLIMHPGKAIVPLASIQLTAVRGEVGSVGLASETDIALADVQNEPTQRIEVVDAGGAKIWSGSADAGKVKVTKQLSEGTYFVRLYDGGGKLLHEYGFRVGKGL